MPLTRFQQVVTAHASNATYQQAIDKLMRHLDTLPECRIHQLHMLTPKTAPIVEATANAVVAVIEFRVPIDSNHPFPARVSL